MVNQSTILIVEDNDYNLQIAVELLKREGYRTLEAQDVDTGIMLARQQHPDLILMDMYLPFKDGYEATRIIKADPQTRDIPVVAFTALAMPDDCRRAQAAGCVGVISKPIVVDTFAQTVESYLDGSLSVQTPQQQMMGPKDTVDSDFQRQFSKLSHDLQGPLRKIRQFCGFIQSSDEADMSLENRQFVAGIERSVRQMEDSLESFLETTKPSSPLG